MFLRPNLPVTVNLFFDHHSLLTYPKAFVWQEKVYSVKEIKFHTTFRSGKTLYHVFNLESENSLFRLVLDTDSLNWVLDEVSDKEEGW